MEATRKCPICGAPYKVYSMTVADQTACRECVAEAERAATDPTPDEQARRARRRRQFWLT